jgi:ureidoacrylate peracid hydrolase
MSAPSVHLDRPALLVIDMQNGFCHPRGSLARGGAPIAQCQATIQPVASLVAAARASSVPVIFTRFVYRADYADGGILVRELRPHLKERRSLVAGDWDAEIVDDLQPRPGDYIIDKNRFSAFVGTDLQAVLDRLEVRTLIVCGVTTNMCVESTVRDAGQRDYRVYVVRDAVGELDPERHEHALRAMAFGFGYVVSGMEIELALGELSPDRPRQAPGRSASRRRTAPAAR